MTKTMFAMLTAAGLALTPAAALAQTTVTASFDFVDSNNTGYVSFVELQAAFEDEGNLTRADFDRFDTDGSGRLDIDEFELAQTSLGTESFSPSTAS